MTDKQIELESMMLLTSILMHIGNGTAKGFLHSEELTKKISSAMKKARDKA